MYELWCDGSCAPNPGPGGWACVLVAPDGEQLRRSGGEIETTNNRMELTAAIEGLCLVPWGAEVVVNTDSRYVADAFLRQWVASWQRRAWRTAAGSAVKNADLWQTLVRQVAQRTVTWKHVYGHTGVNLNEVCDFLAGEARRALANV